jgi:tripartite-type tricarboxylate transporter receptor subunit TctC
MTMTSFPSTRLAHALVAATLLVLGGGAVWAKDNFPTQGIKIIVPFAAGGGVDVVARIVAPRLSEVVGQSVVIENRGGAGGALGATAVVQSPPDGYTLLLGTGSTHGTNSSVYARLSYDPVRDFAPIALLSTSPLVLVTHPSVPARSVKDLIAFAKAKPGELSFGSYGVGSINHLGGELFNSMAGIQANHIPYRGSAPMMTDLVAGRVQYALDGVSTTLGYIQAGTVRMLAVTGTNRSPIHPDQPTVAESALPGFDTTVWFGLFAPASTPQAVVDLLNQKANAALGAPGVKESLAKLGIEAVGGSPEVLAKKVQTEVEKWKSIVLEKNIRVDQ